MDVIEEGMELIEDDGGNFPMPEWAKDSTVHPNPSHPWAFDDWIYR